MDLYFDLRMLGVVSYQSVLLQRQGSEASHPLNHIYALCINLQISRRRISQSNPGYVSSSPVAFSVLVLNYGLGHSDLSCSGIPVSMLCLIFCAVKHDTGSATNKFSRTLAFRDLASICVSGLTFDSRGLRFSLGRETYSIPESRSSNGERIACTNPYHLRMAIMGD